ncbi:DUF4084 domain-containing protein [Salmonella enterica]|uniref:DUF4084 domain-containing protein n=2 Tax=Salmonella enterica TaxID=28901 RepID=A0A756ZK46_SALER|nr:DUF4084 domain-containing protein [Salmonella enterica]EKA2762101.1 DUF4084 domain-containing protein [Salmonella enterica subsp. enterica serovar Anatum]HAS9552451.1 DUF4084 domain-containing protein [Salmonella enterica subsp. enterica serovar Typhimurium]HCM4464367.1 DUF4084 domain-containing protein [Salmonella enterica subsp. enterica serovar Heidelberg]EGP9365969.1 DUF4084 domain-containing protein [Salmonella enterica]
MEIKRPFSVSFRDERRHATSYILRADNVIEGDLTLGGLFLATEGDADIQMLVHVFLLCLNTLFSCWCYYRNKKAGKKNSLKADVLVPIYCYVCIWLTQRECDEH